MKSMMVISFLFSLDQLAQQPFLAAPSFPHHHLRRFLVLDHYLQPVGKFSGIVACVWRVGAARPDTGL